MSKSYEKDCAQYVEESHVDDVGRLLFGGHAPTRSATHTQAPILCPTIARARCCALTATDPCSSSSSSSFPSASIAAHFHISSMATCVPDFTLPA